MKKCACKPSAAGARTHDQAAGRDHPECRCRPRQDTSTSPARRSITVDTTIRRTTEKVQSYEPANYRTSGAIVGPSDLCHEVDLMQFIVKVGPRVEDRGMALRLTMDDELGGYRSLVEDVFATRNKDMSHSAAHYQRELGERYQQWTQCLKQRIKANNTWLSLYAPDFDWQQYYRDPQYITRLFTDNMDTPSKEEETLSQQRMQNLHKLYWLREQVRREKAENNRLTNHLSESRRKNQEQLLVINMHRDLMQEKQAELQYEVQHLKGKRDKLSDKLGELFAKLENVNTSSTSRRCSESPQRCSESPRR